MGLFSTTAKEIDLKRAWYEAQFEKAKLQQGVSMGVVGPSIAGSGLYNQLQDATRPTKAPLSMQVQDAENGYVVHVNGRTYVAENAEQVAGILTTQLIARGGS